MNGLMLALAFTLASALAIVTFWVVPLLLVYRHKPDGAAEYKTRAEREAAAARAEELLTEMLTAEEREQLLRLGYMEVASPTIPGRVYRIPRRQDKVRVYDAGKPVALLCIGPERFVPDADVVLLHKLMIEGDEREYLRRANRWAP
jgi:hypothetical protein